MWLATAPFPANAYWTLKDRCSVFLLGNHDLSRAPEIDIGPSAPRLRYLPAGPGNTWTEDAFEVLRRGLGGTSAEQEDRPFHALAARSDLGIRR